MVPENDPVLEFLERWKKRVFAAFLLIASIFGATALLILEYGVVEKAWGLEIAAAAVADVAAAPALAGDPPAKAKRQKQTDHARQRRIQKKQNEGPSGCVVEAR